MDDHRELLLRGHGYDDIIAVENLLVAWREFIRGKRKKADVQAFESRLMDNILGLHADLAAGTYKHGGYDAFKISDPKPRDIHKASVRDRLLHHAVYRVLYPILDREWVHDSYSCRDGKGTHRAMERFKAFGATVSKNDTRTCYVLKCDIRKFFASIDHSLLLRIVSERVDARTAALIGEIVGSFAPTVPGVGLPLGNLTSQLLVNAYMNEFDQFAKHDLKARFYIRYADDFVMLSDQKPDLEAMLPRIAAFLHERLRLSLHPDKVYIKTLSSGVDFLGWVHFPDHRVLRAATRKRMLRNLSGEHSTESGDSYLALLLHGNAIKLAKKVRLSTPLSTYPLRQNGSNTHR